jgi:hypothetical protein
VNRSSRDRRGRRTGPRRDTISVRLGLECLEERQLLTVNVSGNGNTDAASLLAAGGPGNPSAAGFVSVGRGSTNNTSVTYLGGGWAITAAHVTIDNSVGPVRFGASEYQVDMSSITVLHNDDDSPTDLKVFRLATDPGLPAILPSMISAGAPAGRQILIGNGLNLSTQRYWQINTAPSTWVWTEQAAPAVPAANDASGFDTVGPRIIRWGENHVKSTNLQLDYGNGTVVRAYKTQFDDTAYTGITPLPSEAQATVGDSGGAVFSFSGGQWMLAGIIVAVGPFNGQPASTAVFGNATYIADLSYYRDEILEITASVQGRGLFYNGSTRYDTTDAPQAPLPYAKDNAIAPDKVAYLPGGGAATFANVSSYPQGINGLYVDVSGMRPNITAADFVFKLGNNNTPSTWVPAPAPQSVVVRPGAGVHGADRVEIVWADGDICNTWLEVTLAANANTGLAEPDRFYFANAVADTGQGNTATQATVNTADELAVRNNSAPLFANIPITNVYDFNRDGMVNTTDVLLARNNVTGLGNVVRFLNLSNPPSAPEAAPASDEDLGTLWAGAAVPIGEVNPASDPSRGQRRWELADFADRRGPAAAIVFTHWADPGSENPSAPFHSPTDAVEQLLHELADVYNARRR